MKVVVIVRTLNEESNIARFITAYQNIADEIIVADGGSEDATIDIAKTFHNAHVYTFPGREEMEGGIWRNPEADHFNFAIEKAKKFNPDWILQQDADEYPNYMLRKDGRGMLSTVMWDWVYAVRVYLWKHGHLLNKSQPGLDGVYEASMWGWKPKRVDPVFYDTDSAYAWKPKIDDPGQRYDIMPPHCLIHDYQKDRIQKVAKYRQSGWIPGANYPEDEQEYNLVEKEWWMK